jgi:aspartyl protease family protein
MRCRGGVLMLAIGWALAIGVVFWLFHGWHEREVYPNRVLTVSGPDELVLKRSRAGQYLADGEVNGHRVTCLLDTGATHVALSTQLARSLDLELGPAVKLLTAAGPARGYRTRLDSVRLAGFEVRDVSALVSDGLEPALVLLGMNFLQHFEMIQRGDQLILKPLPRGPGKGLPQATRKAGGEG